MGKGFWEKIKNGVDKESGEILYKIKDITHKLRVVVVTGYGINENSGTSKLN